MVQAGLCRLCYPLPLSVAAMFSFFRRSKPEPTYEALTTDMHSHLLPGLDDGSASMDETMQMLTTFADRGYRRLYTTPHILSDYYPNSPETILPALEEVRKEVKVRGLEIEIYAAAEYYMDDAFIEAVDQGKPLLSIGPKKYLLFETAFINEPVHLRDVIFKLFSNGYTPVLAHPERYQYFFDNMRRVQEIYDSGVLFQVNHLSFANYYAPPVTKLAEALADAGMIQFLGTDCHKPRHLEAMKQLSKSKHWKKALASPLLNREI